MPGTSTSPITVFHLTHPKSGSQWVYQVLEALFPHRIVYPQTWNGHFHHIPIQEGKIYPTVYVNRSEFESVKVPARHRKFFMLRDLRDTLVSLYFSARYSHSVDSHDRLSGLRKKLSEMTEAQGMELLFTTELRYIADTQLSWLGGDLPVYRYEDAIKDPLTFFRTLLDHCELKVSTAMLSNVVEAMSFRKKSGRAPGTEDRTSHYRRGMAGDWRNHLGGDLLARFQAIYGTMLVETGYESKAPVPVPLRDSPAEVSAERRLPLPDIKLLEEPAPIRLHRHIGYGLLHRQWVQNAAARPEISLQQDTLITGTGFYPVEQHEGQSFCWVADRAELTVRRPSGGMVYLQVELEPGPSAGRIPMNLRVLNQNGAVITGAEISERQVITLDLSACVARTDEDWTLTLLVEGPGPPVPGDPRTMCYRVLRFGWVTTVYTATDAWGREVSLSS